MWKNVTIYGIIGGEKWMTDTCTCAHRPRFDLSNHAQVHILFGLCGTVAYNFITNVFY